MARCHASVCLKKVDRNQSAPLCVSVYNTDLSAGALAVPFCLWRAVVVFDFFARTLSHIFCFM